MLKYILIPYKWTKKTRRIQKSWLREPGNLLLRLQDHIYILESRDQAFEKDKGRFEHGESKNRGPEALVFQDQDTRNKFKILKSV